MKRMSEKITESPLKCDSETCPFASIKRDDDVVVIHYRRGEAFETLLPINRITDWVEVYHADCAPSTVRIKLRG